MRAMCESRRSCFHTRLVGVSSPTHQYSKCRTCYCHGRPTHDAKPLRPCFGAIAVRINYLQLPYTLAHENPSFQYQRALQGARNVFSGRQESPHWKSRRLFAQLELARVQFVFMRVCCTGVTTDVMRDGSNSVLGSCSSNCAHKHCNSVVLCP